jgi:hypothetical protein
VSTTSAARNCWRISMAGESLVKDIDDRQNPELAAIE